MSVPDPQLRESTASTGWQAGPKVDCAFYTVSDSAFFPGAVALVNSLRLVGHREPIFLVDAGLTPEQRDMISRHVILLPAPKGVHPMLLKMVGPLTYPAGVAVLLDADIIVTRPCTELVDAARGGRLVGFVNNHPNDDRFFPEWSSTLALGPLRRQRYLASGQLFVPDLLNRKLLEPWQEGQAKIDMRRTLVGRGTLSDPFYFPDMDVFNAVVAAHLDADEMLILENRLAPNPPFVGLRMIDRKHLVCGYDNGEQPFLLHHILGKPWLKATRTNIYSELLPRLLFATDLAVRLEPKQLPLRLREGQLAAADRRRANVQMLLYSEARAQLGRFGIRTRIANWRRRRPGSDSYDAAGSLAITSREEPSRRTATPPEMMRDLTPGKGGPADESHRGAEGVRGSEADEVEAGDGRLESAR